MRMHYTDAEFTDATLRLIKEVKPKIALLSTYGLYAGITESSFDTLTYGEKYLNGPRKILEALGEIQTVNIMVGITAFFSCNRDKRCAACEEKYVGTLIRLVNHAEKWPSYNWRFVTNHHLKGYLFFGENNAKGGIAGGRNLSGSQWTDASFELDPPEINSMLRHFSTAWDNAHPTTLEEIQAYVDTVF